MSASFSSALGAALEAAGSQHYPQGALYVVATPIGNLADISLRALHLLALADRVACEDTRHTQALLRAYGIDKPAAQLLAVHQHNEAQAAHTVVELLHAGLRVAYVSDAGTPGISDPGARLVAQVRAQGLRVVPMPGASSVTTALSAAGVLCSVAVDRRFMDSSFNCSAQRRPRGSPGSRVCCLRSAVAAGRKAGRRQSGSGVLQGCSVHPRYAAGRARQWG